MFVPSAVRVDSVGPIAVGEVKYALDRIVLADSVRLPIIDYVARKLILEGVFFPRGC